MEILSYGRSARARSVPGTRSFKVLNVLDEPSVGLGRLSVRGIRDSARGQSASRIRTPKRDCRPPVPCPPRCRMVARIVNGLACGVIAFTTPARDHCAIRRRGGRHDDSTICETGSGVGGRHRGCFIKYKALVSLGVWVTLRATWSVTHGGNSAFAGAFDYPGWAAAHFVS